MSHDITAYYKKGTSTKSSLADHRRCIGRGLIMDEGFSTISKMSLVDHKSGSKYSEQETTSDGRSLGQSASMPSRKYSESNNVGCMTTAKLASTVHKLE